MQFSLQPEVLQTLEEVDAVAVQILERLVREACAFAAGGTIVAPDQHVLSLIHVIGAIQLVTTDAELANRATKAAKKAASLD
jgi:predicted nucleic acid-binding protein